MSHTPNAAEIPTALAVAGGAVTFLGVRWVLGWAFPRAGFGPSPDVWFGLLPAVVIAARCGAFLDRAIKKRRKGAG